MTYKLIRNNNNYTIKQSYGHEVKYYYGYQPNKDGMKLLVETDELTYSFTDQSNQRIYLSVKTNQDEMIVAERTLTIEGTINFRDLGGYKGLNGKRVKWGKLYRSDQLSGLSQDAIDYVKSLSIEHIVDFRSDDEVAKYPNKEIHAIIHRLNPDAQTAELSAQFSSSKEKENESLIKTLSEMKKSGSMPSPHKGMYSQYKNFVNHATSKRVFSELLRIAAHQDAYVILQHCRGGKDRTGFGAMLLLGVLGVSKEDIVNDYMLTCENRIERNNRKMNEYRQLTSDQEILDYLYALIETNPLFIETSYEEIVSQYGSIMNYVQTELRITQDEIKQIQANYLE